MKIAKIMDNKLQCPGIWRGLPEVYKKIPTKDMDKLICAGDYDTQLCSVNFPSLNTQSCTTLRTFGFSAIFETSTLICG